jgi:hypothetical protein
MHEYRTQNYLQYFLHAPGELRQFSIITMNFDIFVSELVFSFLNYILLPMTPH